MYAIRSYYGDELEWVRSNPKGRRAKSKARLQRFEELSSREYQKQNETREIYIPPGPRLGDQVIEVENVITSYSIHYTKLYEVAAAHSLSRSSPSWRR